MEGSFGTEKEHYGLQKIKARTELIETLWIFLGLHTANAVRIAKRLAVSRVESLASKPDKMHTSLRYWDYYALQSLFQ